MEFFSYAKTFLVMGTFYGFMAVALGAFGAHALKERLTPEFATTFEIGVRYQMYHAFALIATAFAFSVTPNGWMQAAGWLFFFGTLVFSGSLYVLALSTVRAWGAVTPIGGLMLLAGWVCLFMGAIKK